MLANALLCPDLQSVSSTYKEVTFYFDTPLLVQYLGLEGVEKQQSCNDLVALVQRLDGKVSFFTHTRDELLNVINGAAEYIDSPKGRGAVIFEARRAGTSRSDLVLTAQNAVEKLAASGIEAHPTPGYIHEFQIEETTFSDALNDEVNYYNPNAREYDINSVRSIYVLRKGTCPHTVEKAKAVFVTNNTGFSKAAYEYGKKIEQSREVSTVITDFSLANTAWLKAPQGAPSLPRREVLAFAYAALRPTSEFWEKFLAEADKLQKSGTITPRDHQILRSSLHVQEELMKLTLGEDAALTEEKITETLNRVVSEIKKEDSHKLDLSEKARGEAERKFQDALTRNESIKEKIYWRCDKTAKREALLLSILIWISQGAVAVVGVIKLTNQSELGWALLSVAGVSGLLRLAGTFWDLKPLKVYSLFREWRCHGLVQKENSALGIDE
ncbi:hypothetical protein Dace_1824 [Desulfuromonas acetoxidans DSM 684]|uniref:Uncharacterized protein n=2 Tax=Desulfuromonas acetoxidans TaxID=891 RepID=Q1K1M8_DESA6|nr:hypothetical protein Dace_1824 [Desulfuromonas acetoxidans DSM 684]